jgi:hypothetical protein
MTRQFNQVFTCVNCGCTSTTESSFGRWIRENEELDSQKQHIVIYDMDYIVHKYKTHHGRSFQLLMIIEVKTRNSDMTDAQRDTLYILSQLTQNRRENNATLGSSNKWNSNEFHKLSTSVTSVWSPMQQKMVSVKSFGLYKLQFSNLGPADSEEILWNGKPIKQETLTKLLRFDIDPNGFRPIEDLFRVHHKRKNLPLFESY